MTTTIWPGVRTAHDADAGRGPAGPCPGCSAGRPPRRSSRARRPSTAVSRRASPTTNSPDRPWRRRALVDELGTGVDARVARPRRRHSRRQHALARADLEDRFAGPQVEQVERRGDDQRLVIAAALVADPAVVPGRDAVPARVAGLPGLAPGRLAGPRCGRSTRVRGHERIVGASGVGRTEPTSSTSAGSGVAAPAHALELEPEALARPALPARGPVTARVESASIEEDRHAAGDRSRPPPIDDIMTALRSRPG